MGKCISTKKLTDTLSLSECNDGFWLYDQIQGMNLSMRAKTEEEAFVETISYYQKRFLNISGEYTDLKKKVDSFVNNFIEEDETNY